MKVIFAWKVQPDIIKYFNDILTDDIILAVPKGNDAADVVEAGAGARIMIPSTNLSREMLTALPSLECILFPFIGVDMFIPFLKELPHLKTAVSRGNTIPTAQHALALLLAVTNRILPFDRKMREGRWRSYDEELSTMLLHKMTIGVLGTGSVGTRLIQLLKPFGARILACSRSGAKIENDDDVETFSIDRLHVFLESLNSLMICVPRTSETEGMIGEKEIARMQPGSILVNVARGSIVQENALYDALVSGRLGGAGIDVWYNYRPEEIDGKKYPFSHPFHHLPNIVLSPHRAASPLRRLDRFDDVIENIIRFNEGRDLLNRIDLERGY